MSKVKGLKGQTGKIILKFCCYWTQNLRRAHTIQIQNSLQYEACFVTIVMQRQY